METPFSNNDTDARLQGSEECWKLALDAVGDGVWDWDIQADRSSYSRRWKEMLGYADDEIGTGVAEWMQRIHPEDFSRAMETLHAYFDRTNPAYRIEHRLRCKDGSWKWILSRGAMLSRDAQGKPLRMIGIHTDISEQKRIEEELRRGKVITEAIFNSAPGIIYLYNDQGLLVRWNKQHEELTGYSAGELAKMKLLDWYPGDEKSQKAVAEGLRRTVEFGFGDAQADLQRKDGSKIPMYFTASPLEIDGKSYFVGIGLDMTELRRAEAEKEKLQSQLVQAQKMESVGRLAGGVAHDFNNMLGVILGHVELAMERIEPESPIHDDLVEIRKAAQRSADLTHQLLAFARKQTINPKVLDLNATISGTLRMLQRLIGESIQLAWQPGEALWPVKMDPSQVDQLLANLTVNARDAMQGAGVITIQTANAVAGADFTAAHADSQPGAYVMLSVGDTGCGMDAETKSHIFEPFFTTKEVGEGTGLGLATVYGIVKQNAGMIHVATEQGKGSVFQIYLPRSADSKTSENSTPSTKAARGTETVLVVEDEEQILNLSRKILAQHGYTVLAVSMPEQALELVRQHAGPIHLLVADIVMPGMNGRDLWLKISSFKPEMKCLFMSGYTADVIAREGVLGAEFAFLPKPFLTNAFASKVREVLDAKTHISL